MDINIEEIKLKLVNRLRPSEWTDKLKTFLLSSDFDNIIEYLYNESKAGRKFTPVLKDMFSAFENCPYKDLKVVLVLQDPYYQMINGITVADGMAMSCSHTGKLQPSLDYVFKAIDRTVYPDTGYENPNPDLTRWANQGVLLLNTALSTEVGKAGAHQHIWKPFTCYLLDILNSINSGLVFIFMGKAAQEYESLISDNRHYKLFCTHPASAAYKKLPLWESDGVFSKTNDILRGAINDKIIW